MDVTIRAYRPEDREACHELWRELTQHHRDIYADQSIGGEDPGGYFDEYLAHPHFAAASVAEIGGEVVGLTGLQLDGTEAEVEPVVVRATHRGQGVGRRLVEFVIEDAKQRGLRSLSIRPVARNAAAIRHFHAAGFQVLGRIEMFQSLVPSDKTWESGINIHGQQLQH